MGKHCKSAVTYYYRGSVERPTRRRKDRPHCPSYIWHRGYSEGGETPQYPWMTRVECVADARARGSRAVFEEEP